MSWGDAGGNGIGAGGELTQAEELFVQNLAGLAYQTGDLIYYNGTTLTRLAIGSANQILKVSSGIPAWINPTSAEIGDFNEAVDDEVNALLSVGTGLTKTYNDSSNILTLSLDATLVALSGLNSSAGYLVQTAADTFTKRTLTGTTNQVVITNGDGTTGNPVFSLPQSINTSASVTFGELTLSANGLIVGTSQLVASGGNVGIGTASPSARLHVMVTSATQKLRVGYDASNYLGVDVTSAGIVSFTATGSSPAFRIANLTSNGFVKTSGGDGTLIVDTSTYLTASGVTPGTYRSVTVDSNGLVTAGTNPTTFAGYAISDTSANLASAITDETGSGVLVFGTSPTFTTDITTPIAKLSDTSNQLVFQSAGVTGTISWSPATSNKTITLPNGTTNFTATGTTGGVLRQNSVGAAITVSQLAASDLSNGTTGSGAIVLQSSPSISTPTITVPTITFSGSETTASIALATLYHQSSATPGTNFGAELDFYLDDATVDNQLAGALAVRWSDAVHATRTSYIQFVTTNSATSAEAARITGAGDFLNTGYLRVGSLTPPVSGNRVSGDLTATRLSIGNSTINGIAYISGDLGVVSGVQTMVEIKRNTGNFRGLNMGYIADGASDNEAFIAANNARAMAFGHLGNVAGATPTMYLQTNGRVGIGNNAPQSTVEISGAADPTIRLSEGSSTTSYLQIVDVGTNNAHFRKVSAAGISPLLDFDAVPADGTSVAAVRYLRNLGTSGTTGAASLQVFLGDGTATANAQIGGNADTYFAANNGLVAIGRSGPGAQLHIASVSNALSRASWTTSGIGLRMDAATYTNTTSAGGATVATQVAHGIGIPTFDSTNSITVTNAATWYIGGAPVAAGNTTITNAFSLFIDTGDVRLDGNMFNVGNVVIGATSAATARLHLKGNMSSAAWTNAGIALFIQAATYTDTSSSGTVANNYANVLNTPTLAASNTTTYTTAATLLIGAAPVAGTNVTITNSYGLYNAATSRFDGNITLSALNFILDATTGSKWGTAITQKQGWWNATPVIQDTGWTITNKTTDRVLDCNATTLDEVADVLGTLVDVMKSYGLLGA